MVSPDSECASSSVLCSCCLGSKKRKPNSYETQLFQPTMVYSTEFPDSVPKIVISGPTSSRSDAFLTARTSRPEEAGKYSTMTELVDQIRKEAGLDETSKIDEEDEIEFQAVTVSQLRIEGLAELHSNNREPPFPSVSSEYYSTHIDSPRSQNSQPESLSENPSSVEKNEIALNENLEPYRSPYSRKVGELTSSISTNFWRFYSLVVAFIALFLEKILPV